MTTAVTLGIGGCCDTCPCCRAAAAWLAQHADSVAATILAHTDRATRARTDADRQIATMAQERDAALSLIPPGALAGTTLAAVAEMVNTANHLRDTHARQSEAARLAFVDGLHELLWDLDPASAPTTPLYPRARCVIDPADVAGGVAWHLRRVLAAAGRAWHADPNPTPTTGGTP